MHRRSFLRSAARTAPLAALSSLVGQLATAMRPPEPPPTDQLHPVAAGADRYGKLHSLGFSDLAFKVGADETRGNMFVIEHRNLAPGGPPLHMHLSQEEWFYVMEGRVAFVVGENRLELAPGESLLAPRRVPHTFSSMAPLSHMLIAFAPAGKMEEYFRDARGDGKLAATPEYMNRYEMRWIGPSPFHKA